MRTELGVPANLIPGFMHTLIKQTDECAKVRMVELLTSSHDRG